MKALRKFGLMTAALVTISGCSAYEGYSEVEMLNKAQAVGSPFTQQLASEYRDFANFKLDETYDYADALHFARKGLSAAEGVEVMPEPVSDWDLEQDEMIMFSESRARLISAFDRGAREMVPSLSAITQARYDCWIEYEETEGDEDYASTCRDEFMEGMAEIEAQLPAVIEEEPEFIPEPEVEAPSPDTVMDITEATYLVFFDFDKSGIGQGSESVLDAVVTELSGRQVDVVRVVGHTDSSGSPDYNQKLALKRAQAVKDALIARGIDGAMITTEARGESELLVPTEDNVKEPANRRATITFQ